MTKSTNPITEERLLYRRQFFLGSKFIDQFPNWGKLKIGHDLYLTSHPDLQVTSAKKGNQELVLLGFMFDSEDYKSSNSTILSNIILDSNSFEDIIKSTFRYAGRWILIYSCNNEVKLFHDPGGLRQVFFSQSEESTWCASQPHTLAEILGKNRRNNSQLDSLLKSTAFENNERNLVGEDTLFEDVKHLYPNHYLDIYKCAQVRYWPNESLESLPITEVVNKASSILSELVKAAHHRHEIAQTITAGWDTRVLLAASAPVRNNIKYFVQQLPNMQEGHEDISIPLKIAKNNGLDFNVITCSEFDDTIDAINSKNVFMSQSEKKKYQYNNYYKDFNNKMIIGGNVSPLIKELFPTVDTINANNLARLLFYHNEKYAINVIDKWLANTLSISKKYNISIEKLFYWELRFGTWASMYYSELDIAVEEFSPFNCRNLLNILISTPSELRKKPDQYLYQKIIHNMWPELLEYPVNPISSKKSKNLKSIIILKVMALLKRIRLYKSVRYFYRKLI